MEITASENDLYIYMEKSEVGAGAERAGDGEAREEEGGEGTSGKWRGRGEGGQEWVPRGEEGNGKKYTLSFCLLTPTAQLPLQLFTDTLFPLSRTM